MKSQDKQISFVRKESLNSSGRGWRLTVKRHEGIFWDNVMFCILMKARIAQASAIVKNHRMQKIWVMGVFTICKFYLEQFKKS